MDSTISDSPAHAAGLRSICTLLLTAALSCFGMPIALAESADPGSDRLHINGFGTVGMAYIDAPDGWAFTRSIMQHANEHAISPGLDTRIGIQLNYQLGTRLELVGQVVASRLEDDARLGDALELAFAAFRPNADWTLRLGRVNMDAYTLSDHRDVGFAYEFIRPPVEFYSRVPISLDGMDVARVWTTPAAQWRAKLFAGGTSSGTGGSRLLLRPLLGVMFSRESDGLLLRVSAVHAKIDNTLANLQPLLDGLQGVQALPVPQVANHAAFLAARLPVKGYYTNYLGGGINYDRRNWLFSAEINNARVSNHSFASFTTGYASAGRRFGAVTVFGMASVAERGNSRLDVPDWATPLTAFGPAIAQQSQMLAFGATFAANTSAGHQHTTSIGMRWDASPRIALKAQWDHMDVKAEGGGLWKSSTPAATTADVIGLSMDFVF